MFQNNVYAFYASSSHDFIYDLICAILFTYCQNLFLHGQENASFMLLFFIFYPVLLCHLPTKVLSCLKFPTALLKIKYAVFDCHSSLEFVYGLLLHFQLLLCFDLVYTACICVVFILIFKHFLHFVQRMVPKFLHFSKSQPLVALLQLIFLHLRVFLRLRKHLITK